MASTPQPPTDVDRENLLQNEAPVPQEPPPSYAQAAGHRQLLPGLPGYTPPGYTQQIMGPPRSVEQPMRPGPCVVRRTTRIQIVRPSEAIVVKWYRRRCAIWGMVLGFKVVVIIVAVAIIMGNRSSNGGYYDSNSYVDNYHYNPRNYVDLPDNLKMNQSQEDILRIVHHVDEVNEMKNEMKSLSADTDKDKLWKHDKFPGFDPFSEFTTTPSLHDIISRLRKKMESSTRSPKATNGPYKLADKYSFDSAENYDASDTSSGSDFQADDNAPFMHGTYSKLPVGFGSNEESLNSWLFGGKSSTRDLGNSPPDNRFTSSKTLSGNRNHLPQDATTLPRITTSPYRERASERSVTELHVTRHRNVTPERTTTTRKPYVELISSVVL